MKRLAFFPALLAVLCFGARTAFAQAGVWSSPVNVSQASQPAFGEAVVIDSNGTIHTFFNAVPGSGTSQVFHAYRRPGQPWSTPVLISTPGNPNSAALVPESSSYQFVEEDQTGVLHCFFEQVEGFGSQQIWHTQLDTNNLGAGWSTPTNISQSSQPASAQATRIDSNGTVHVFFNALPGLGATQVFHTYRQPGQPWSNPVLVSTPGSSNAGAFIPGSPLDPASVSQTPFSYRFVEEDQTGSLHCFFAQIPGLGVRQIWHTELDTNNLGSGWSPPTNISQSSQPAFAQAMVIDSSGTVHAFFNALPGFGATQVFHAYRQPGQPWSNPVLVSTPGSSGFGATIPGGSVYRFVQEDRAGTLHCFFEQVPGLGVRQTWHTELDTNNLAAGWSTSTNISHSSQPASAQATVIDSNGTLHVLFNAIPGLGAPQVFHTYRTPGQPWSNPVLVSTPGSSGFGATIPGPSVYRFVQEDTTGRLHCFFEQIPGSGARQIWHTELNTNNLGAGWSTPTNVSQSSQLASASAVVVDSNNGLHLFFNTVPTLGMTQVFYAQRRPGLPWSSPVVVSTPASPDNAAVIPAPLPYRFVQEDRAGVLHCLFEQTPGGGVRQVWHTMLDLFGTADVALAKADAPDPVTLGDNLTYTLTVTNSGPDTATGVEVNDPLPPGVTVVSASASQGFCAVLPGDPSGTFFRVGCLIGSLSNGASATVTIVVTPTQSGIITNTASVKADQTDPDTANDQDTEETIVGTADVALAKADAPDPVTVGDNLTYTLTVTNNGPDTATGVDVDDPLPPGVTVDSASASQGLCAVLPGDPSGTFFRVGCLLGSLSNGASATVTIVVTPTQSGTLTNRASVDGDQADPDGTNNEDSVTTTVIGVPTPTLTPVGPPTATFTGTATATATPVHTATPTSTSAPGDTATPTPTSSPTPVPTAFLAAGIGEQAEAIPLDDVTGFPRSGVVRIDDEQISYSSIMLAQEVAIGASKQRSTGVGEGVRTAGSLVVAERGFGGTPVQEHAAGALVTLVSAGVACVGDCADDGEVTINDLITGVNIALGRQPVDACQAFDANHDGRVSVSELIQGVNNALNGCADPFLL